MTIDYAVLKAAIAAETDSAFVALRDSGQTGAMANWYNEFSTIDAWMPAVSAKILDEGADYSSYDTLAAGKRDSWDIFLRYGPRDMTKNKLRKVVTDVWGNAVAASISETILQGCLEKARKGELVFGVNSASTGTVTGEKRNWVGTLTNDDIIKALRA
jgi:hypothetical protein